MIRKPYLPEAEVCSAFGEHKIPENLRGFMSASALQALKGGNGSQEYGTHGDFCVNSTFKLIRYCYEYGAHGFTCEGTKEWLSLFKLTGGCNHLEAFKAKGAEKSADYDTIPSWRILDLPNDYEEAITMIKNLYLGKTIRVVARSVEATQYNTRYYLFALED